jgi:hypothetical protein
MSSIYNTLTLRKKSKAPKPKEELSTSSFTTVHEISNPGQVPKHPTSTGHPESNATVTELSTTWTLRDCIGDSIAGREDHERVYRGVLDRNKRKLPRVGIVLEILSQLCRRHLQEPSTELR